VCSSDLTYDVTTDTWQAQVSPTKPTMVQGVAATPIALYGVTFFVNCNSTTCHAYLYKHNAGNAAESRPVISSLSGLSAWPNPFTKAVRLMARSGNGSSPRAKVFDIRGRQVADLALKASAPGGLECRWEPKGLPGGVYLLESSTNGKTGLQKIFLNK
jgi:hypothetical protein